MSSNTPDPISEKGEDGDLAQDTEVALRKRAASNALDIRVNKRPRHEWLEVNDYLEQPSVERDHRRAKRAGPYKIYGRDEPSERPGAETLREQERLKRSSILTEDDVIYRDFEREVAKTMKYKDSKYDPTHASDPGYDQFYGYSSHRRRDTTAVEDSKGYIICDSPQEALLYFKTNAKDLRRRIKHIIFSLKAVAFGPSLNGMHWKGLCNYIRKYMCIESIMIPVPYDPLAAQIRHQSFEGENLMEEIMENRKYSLPAGKKRRRNIVLCCLPFFDQRTKVCIKLKKN